MKDKNAGKEPSMSTQLTFANENLAKARAGRVDKAKATAAAALKAKLAREKISLGFSGTKANDVPPVKLSQQNSEPTHPCHLMKLPTELRLIIYEHYFRVCFEYTSCTQVPYFTRYVHERRMVQAALALLQTNHILRVEAFSPCKQILEAIQEPLENKLKELRAIYMLHFRTKPGFAREIMEKAGETDLVMQHRTFGKIQNAVQFVERHMIEEQFSQQIDESFKERGRG